MRICMMIGSALTALTLVVAGTATPASADTNDNVTSSEIRNALQRVPGLADASDDTKQQNDGNSIDGTTKAGTVETPKDASDGVSIDSKGSAGDATIALPNADEAGTAKAVLPGVVAYPSNNDGTANAVQSDEHGGVRAMVIIANSDAPTSFDYPVTLPEGGQITLDESGGAQILGRGDNLVGFVAPAWALDARKHKVPASFTTDGTTLTLHVDHTQVDNVKYPVVADPFWIPAYMVYKIIRCGFGSYLGWIASAGWRWYNRAVALIGGCLLALP